MRQKKSQAVGLGIKDLIVAMDQGGVKHCQRGTLKQRSHSKKNRSRVSVATAQYLRNGMYDENAWRVTHAAQGAIAVISDGLAAC